MRDPEVVAVVTAVVVGLVVLGALVLAAAAGAGWAAQAGRAEGADLVAPERAEFGWAGARAAARPAPATVVDLDGRRSPGHGGRHAA